jgi:formylglycine-generating enzyme required for sulfatase activity
MENPDTQPESIAAAQRREQLQNRVLKNGESFGNYRVVKCMCAGLLTHYYHMQHIRDLHDVTVGVFHHRADGNAKFLKSLEALQKTVSTFDHDAIPKIRDCTTIDGHTCIFMDLVKGIRLSQYFETKAKPGQSGLERADAMRIIAQLLGALGYAHSQGVDHRDLDSDLIYIQDNGSIRVLGLGIKASLGVDLFESIVSASVSPLVCSKTVGRLNSFDVMSPEYKSGVVEDARVDVFGAAFLGYWLLTGRKAELAKYVAPTQLVEDLSPNWDLFFDKALARVRDNRYQSCKIALLALKETEEDTQSEGGGVVQRQIDRIPVPRQIVERGELATRIYRLFIIGLIGVTLTAICASYLSMSYSEDVEDYQRYVAKNLSSEEGAALLLRVEPAIAKVEFIGYKKSYVINDGHLNLAVIPNDYKLSISAPNYITQRVPVSILEGAEAPVRLNVNLKPVRSELTIQSEPGASVSLLDVDGVAFQQGVIGPSGTLLFESVVFSRISQMVVEKPGFQTQIFQDLADEHGSISQLDVPLVPLPATVELLTQPRGATILVNDVELGVTPLTLKELVPNDQYVVVARLDGYRSLERLVELKPGAEMTIDLGEFVPSSGELSIGVNILGENPPHLEQLSHALQVYVDEQAIPFGDPQLSSISVGEHRIRLEHPHYLSNELRLEVKDRGKYKLNFDLSARPAIVKLQIPEPLRAEVRLDGHLVNLHDGQIEIPANQEVGLELSIRDHLTMLRQLKLSPAETLLWDVQPSLIPGPIEGKIWTVPYLGISFVWVPPGEFQMGSPLQEHARVPNEGPQTPVRFTQGFWAGTYEVTQSQYEELTGRNPSKFKSAARPVDSVSWEEAKAFCQLLTEFERDAQRLPNGYVYRLPSEAEWEYAARAGTQSSFNFGVEADASLGQFRGVYPRDRIDGLRVPTVSYGSATVGRYEANAFGMFDVHGNVREWTLDRYNGRLSGTSLVDPRPRPGDGRIVVRGGGWEDSAARVRSAVREGVSPEVTSSALGFRVVLAPEF